MFTAMATPTPDALESTGLPSATADELAVDAAWTLCSPVVVIESAESLPTFALVSP
jgi:hypothetical protein